MKKFIFFSFIILILLLFIVRLTTDDVDMCLDTGYCKEGLLLNTQSGQIIVNQENCVINDGTWISDRKYCNFRKVIK